MNEDGPEIEAESESDNIGDGALLAPFPYFGGKKRVAPIIWKRFGDVSNYVEPFAGSLAVLLSRPRPFRGTETVNDADGFISNFWRAVVADPNAVAKHVDFIIHECDLHARHAWLVGRKDSLRARLEGDPDYFDAKVAGWWLYGICLWIGHDWCSGKGPWRVVEVDGVRQLVCMGDAGMGVNRQRIHLGDAGAGVNRKRGGSGDEADTCAAWSEHIRATMRRLADRLRRVRVCCGDWSRVCGGKSGKAIETLVFNGAVPCGVFLDPPYTVTAGRDPRLYNIDSPDVAHRVRGWAISVGDDPRMRVVLCGYEGEHAMPDTWECVAWKAKGGYSNQSGNNVNSNRERLWFSPYCLKPDRRAKQASLFAEFG